MNSDTFIIARAGWSALGIAFAVFVLFSLMGAGFLQLLSFLAFLFIGFVYRNPERIVPYYQTGSIVSVADGTVTAIESIESCELCDEPCYKIEIASGFMDTSVLRVPFESDVSDVAITRGARLDLKNPLAKELNEKATLKFTGTSGEQMFVEHLIERNPAGIVITAHPEHKSAQGGRYGVMIKGVTTIYLPANCRISLHVGDTVSAGETLMGYFSTTDEQ